MIRVLQQNHVLLWSDYNGFRPAGQNCRAHPFGVYFLVILLLKSAVVNEIHAKLVLNRRTKVLATELAEIFPKGAEILDVGCGDGTIDALIMERRPDLSFRGVDVLLRPKTQIPVELFDGAHLPVPDMSFDIVTFVDVLHHTIDPMLLLNEAKRVARKYIVIKDHTRDGLQAYARLRFMDWVGNAHHGVALPYNYLSAKEWRAAFQRTGLTVHFWKADIGLYPFPASLIFGTGLHFIAKLAVA